MRQLPTCFPELSAHLHVSWHVVFRNSVQHVIWIFAWSFSAIARVTNERCYSSTLQIVTRRLPWQRSDSCFYTRMPAVVPHRMPDYILYHLQSNMEGEKYTSVEERRTEWVRKEQSRKRDRERKRGRVIECDWVRVKKRVSTWASVIEDRVRMSEHVSNRVIQERVSIEVGDEQSERVSMRVREEQRERVSMRVSGWGTEWTWEWVSELVSNRVNEWGTEWLKTEWAWEWVSEGGT